MASNPDDILNENDFDDSDSDIDNGDEVIQLGFIEDKTDAKEIVNSNLFDNPDWRDWDGGKVGG